MRNWHLLAGNIDVMPLMASITRQPELWDTQQFLKQFPPFYETDTLYLRFPMHTDGWDNHEAVFQDAWFKLPEAHSHVWALMNAIHGVRLGRVMVNRLPPGATIARHRDMPEHTMRWRRHHLVLHGLPGAVMQVGDEIVPMLTGALFWFNAAVEHEVVNDSMDDRLSMIIDIQTPDVAL